jgi:hypothetical protein
VCFSLVVILALLRGYERAWSRRTDELIRAGKAAGDEGKLSRSELLLILVPSGAALSSFVVGFAFLARIAFHF